MTDGPANEDHVAFGVADVDCACDELRAEGIDVLVARPAMDVVRQGRREHEKPNRGQARA